MRPASGPNRRANEGDSILLQTGTLPSRDFGRTVNAASRIADYARPGEVVVSQEVVDVADATPVSFVEIGPVELKGLSESIRLHTARRDSRTPNG